MKKIISVSIVLTLCLSFAFFMHAAVVPFVESSMAEDFSGDYQGKIDSNWESLDFVYWGGDGTTYVSENGKLKATYQAGGANFGVYIPAPQQEETAIGIWIDASSITEGFFLQFVLCEEYAPYVFLKEGKPVYVVPDSGSSFSTDVETQEGYVMIPAAFKGTVILPFDSFDYDSPDALSLEGIRNAVLLNLQVKLPSDTDLPAGSVVFYDSIRFFTDAQPKETDSEKTVSTAPSDSGVAGSIFLMVLSLIAIGSLCYRKSTA